MMIEVNTLADFIRKCQPLPDGSAPHMDNSLIHLRINSPHPEFYDLACLSEIVLCLVESSDGAQLLNELGAKDVCIASWSDYSSAVFSIADGKVHLGWDLSSEPGELYAFTAVLQPLVSIYQYFLAGHLGLGIGTQTFKLNTGTGSSVPFLTDVAALEGHPCDSVITTLNWELFFDPSYKFLPGSFDEALSGFCNSQPFENMFPEGSHLNKVTSNWHLWRF